MSTTYEWVVETVTRSTDEPEIQDLDHFDSYAEAVAAMKRDPAPEGNEYHVGLVRDSDRDGRGWAYLTDGKLPEWIRRADDSPMVRVPKRFHAEVSK